jgi:hypothetical protein
LKNSYLNSSIWDEPKTKENNYLYYIKIPHSDSYIWDESKIKQKINSIFWKVLSILDVFELFLKQTTRNFCYLKISYHHIFNWDEPERKQKLWCFINSPSCMPRWDWSKTNTCLLIILTLLVGNAAFLLNSPHSLNWIFKVWHFIELKLCAYVDEG